MNYIVETNFLNVKEVSVLLKLSALTVYKYISEKKIKAIHCGGRYLIDKSSLNKFTPHRNVSKITKYSNHSNRKVLGAGFTKQSKSK